MVAFDKIRIGPFDDPPNMIAAITCVGQHHKKICHLYGTDRTVVLRHHGKRQNFRCPYPPSSKLYPFQNMFLFNRNIAYHIIHCLPCFCVCVDIQLVFARQDPTPWIWSRCSWVTKIASRSSGLRPTSSNNEVIFLPLSPASTRIRFCCSRYITNFLNFR